MPLLLSEPNSIHEQKHHHHHHHHPKIANPKRHDKLMPMYTSRSPSERHHSASSGRHGELPVSQPLNISTVSSSKSSSNIPVVMKTGYMSHLSSNYNNNSNNALFRLTHNNSSASTSNNNSAANHNSSGKQYNGSASNNNLTRMSMNLPSKSSLVSNNTTSRAINNTFSSEKKKRSDSVSSLLPLKENTQFNNSSSSSSSNNNNNNITHQASLSSSMNGSSNNGRSSSKPGGSGSNGKASPAPPAIPKRQKSNSLSIMDYCNIMSTNTNYQIMANFTNLSDDVFESTAAALSNTNSSSSSSSSNSNSNSNSTSNVNYQKQASLAEQMVAMFGSLDCTCFLCVNNANRKSPNQINYEIVANRHNSDFSIMKYTYSAPLSQLSSLKLFNMFNCDCSISFKLDNRSNSSSGMMIFL
jgi:hypothetical protein